MSDTNENPSTDDPGLLNGQITDSLTQVSVHTLGLGPAVAAVNGYLGQAQAQSILFANMVNQQAQLATIAAATLTDELGELLKSGDTQ
ncbi:MAG TPA: RebB family R body protein [Rhodocyclaceae bacterium]